MSSKKAHQYGAVDDLQSRGVKDTLFLCSDNLKGLNKAVQAIFPQSIHQICIVHQIRNSLRDVSYKDRKVVVKVIKEIYQAGNEEMAQKGFEKFKADWNTKYPMVVKVLGNKMGKSDSIFGVSQKIRKLIYTTNIIENFNARLQKYTLKEALSIWLSPFDIRIFCLLKSVFLSISINIYRSPSHLNTVPFSGGGTFFNPFALAASYHLL